MTPRQILDSFSETLVQDERILSQRERALLSSLLHHAKQASNHNPETHEAVNAVFASAVGETIAQRAFAVLGSSVVDRILAPIAGGVTTQDRTIYGMPQPPSPSTGPQPPGIQPPVVPVPSTPPTPPAPPPSDTPKGPQPPGHGSLPWKVNRQRDAESGTAVLDTPWARKPETLTAQCVVLDEFLAPQELASLVDYALQRESDFQVSEVIAPANAGVVDYEHRRSRVLMDLGKHERTVIDRVSNVLPLVLGKLGMEDFSIASVESQITSSNDGDFFRVHPDNGHDEVAGRYLTFVYFFHREPKQFEGGELRIHDARLHGEHYVITGNYQTIVPQQNQIVFFPCAMLHEITPVKCPTGAFADSRFTLNGWLRR
jgi:Rps23 Pro-64 3,4-dihydroxylase Tpa1-like proline 4-hydroxylase